MVEFGGVAAQRVPEREWPPSQNLKSLLDGRLRFEAEVSHLDDIWPWVLSWGSAAKVLAPGELLKVVAAQAAETTILRPTKSEGMFSMQLRAKDVLLCPTANDVWFTNGPLP